MIVSSDAPRREPQARKGTSTPRRGPCSPSSHTTASMPRTGGRAGDPPGGREPQGLGREQDLAGSRHPSKDDEPHPHRRPAETRRDRVPHTPRPGTHAGGRTPAAFSRRTTLLRSSFNRDGLSRDPLSKYLAGPTGFAYLTTVTRRNFLRTNAVWSERIFADGLVRQRSVWMRAPPP